MRPIADALALTIAGFALIAGVPAPAAAQHHHHHAGHGEEAAAAPRLQSHAGISAEMGTVEFFGEERDYQGLAVMAGARLDRFEAALHLPFYRVDLGSQWGEGVGDPHVEARWIAFASGAVEAGASFAVMPPVGNDDDGLGMGHWMIMTGGFARAGRGRLSGNASLGYGGGLGGGGHAEHGGGVWPPLAPMNAHEIEAALGGRLALGHGVGLSVALSGAAPLGDGELLALGGLGATIMLGPVELGLGIAHGLLEHPTGLRASTHLMASF